MRVGMIHQPHFLPWPGYIARCLAADTVVLLDSVKFNRNHFQHRTKYVTRAGAERWLTLPISHATRAMPIARVEIAGSFGFLRWQRGFREAYGHEAEFGPVWGDISRLIRSRLPSLSRVATATLAYLLDAVTLRAGGRSPLLVAGSSIATSCERTQRLVDICADQEVSHLIMGVDAVRCHDCDLLRDAGLTLVRHVYRGPLTRLPQPGVTVLHDVFRSGWVEAAERLTKDWAIETIPARPTA